MSTVSTARPAVQLADQSGELTSDLCLPPAVLTVARQFGIEQTTGYSPPAGNHASRGLAGEMNGDKPSPHLKAATLFSLTRPVTIDFMGL